MRLPCLCHADRETNQMQVEADLQGSRDRETPGEALEKALFQVDCSAE